MGVGWGTVLGRSGIGGGIREWNVEFILLGAQLFILIFPVSCCIFLILGLNPDSTSLTVAEQGKADIVGYSPAPALTTLGSHCSKLLKWTRRNQAPPTTTKEMPAPPIRSTLCPSMGNWGMTVCHPRLRPTPNGHDSRSWPSQRCLGISVLLVHWTGRISSWCWLSCEHEAAIPPQATSGSPGGTHTRCLMPSLYLASTVSEERP